MKDRKKERRKENMEDRKVISSNRSNSAIINIITKYHLCE